MAGLNKVLLIGNLTRDPASRATPGGTSICEMGLAINRRFRTASGEDREETCFVDIDVFGRQAEQCVRYLRKGSLAFVEGRLRLDQWEDRTTGQNRSRLKVTAERVQFLDTRSRQDDGDSGYVEGGRSQGSGPSRGGTPRSGARPAQPFPGPRDAGERGSFEPQEDGGTVGDNASEGDEAVDDIPF
ncbi:MAG: single-stranded DNA-binding protein [Lentisphaeria bacterium]|nr:single-stranded DNA-binding protein [Lentisphaeria bacterium]